MTQTSILNKSSQLGSLGLLMIGLFIISTGSAQIQHAKVLNAPIDVSEGFHNYLNTFYFADRLVEFDPKRGKGAIRYQRNQFHAKQAFNNMLIKADTIGANEFPATEYEASPVHPFQIQFVSDRTLRIKISSGPQYHAAQESLMLVDGKAPDLPEAWNY